jgi:hypothetical protein
VVREVVADRRRGEARTPQQHRRVDGAGGDEHVVGPMCLAFDANGVDSSARHVEALDKSVEPLDLGHRRAEDVVGRDVVDPLPRQAPSAEREALDLASLFGKNRSETLCHQSLSDRVVELIGPDIQEPFGEAGVRVPLRLVGEFRPVDTGDRARTVVGPHDRDTAAHRRGERPRQTAAGDVGVDVVEIPVDVGEVGVGARMHRRGVADVRTGRAGDRLPPFGDRHPPPGLDQSPCDRRTEQTTTDDDVVPAPDPSVHAPPTVSSTAARASPSSARA